jgi:hypothetical protein
LPSRGAFVPPPPGATPPPSSPPSEPTDGPVADAASPFAPGAPGMGAGAHVAALQEPPPQPMPFTVPGDARGPWLPSELRTSVGEEPPEPPESHGANGTDAPDDTEGRPSEWGRAVFDPQTPDTDRSTFG